VLEARLRNRRTEDDETFKRRMARVTMEMGTASEFDHQVVNDDLQVAIEEVDELIRAHTARGKHKITFTSPLKGAKPVAVKPVDIEVFFQRRSGCLRGNCHCLQACTANPPGHQVELNQRIETLNQLTNTQRLKKRRTCQPIPISSDQP